MDSGERGDINLPHQAYLNLRSSAYAIGFFHIITDFVDNDRLIDIDKTNFVDIDCQ